MTQPDKPEKWMTKPADWRNPSCREHGNGVVCCSTCYNSHGSCVDNGSCEKCHHAVSPENLTFCRCDSCMVAHARKLSAMMNEREHEIVSLKTSIAALVLHVGRQAVLDTNYPVAALVLHVGRQTDTNYPGVSVLVPEATYLDAWDYDLQLKSAYKDASGGLRYTIIPRKKS